jgi:hypothetical protein
MRSDARFGDPVHVFGADLRLDGYTVRSKQRRVQRLIAIHARDGDVILESTWHRFEHGMHDAERPITRV